MAQEELALRMRQKTGFMFRHQQICADETRRWMRHTGKQHHFDFQDE
jgi:hypothetical protein